MQGSNSYSSSDQRYPVSTTPPAGTLTGPESFQAGADVNTSPPPVDFRIQVAVSSPPVYGVPQFDMRQLALSYSRQSVPNCPSSDIGKFYVGSTELYSGSKVNLDIGGGVTIKWKPRRMTKPADLAALTIVWKCSYGARCVYPTCSTWFVILETQWTWLGAPGWLVQHMG